MDITPITLIINTVFLVVSIVLIYFMLRYGVVYGVHYGDSTVQDQLKWKIIRIVMVLIVIGLLASVYNIVVPWLFA